MLTQANVAEIASNWASSTPEGQAIGGEVASHMGFAAVATGDGRTTAVAVFGGRM